MKESWRCDNRRRTFGQIHFVIWTNTFCDLDKYILKLVEEEEGPSQKVKLNSVATPDLFCKDSWKPSNGMEGPPRQSLSISCVVELNL